jgi:hypothetical protein
MVSSRACGQRGVPRARASTGSTARELGGVAGDPDADEAGIGGHIRHDLAKLLNPRNRGRSRPRIAFGAIIGPRFSFLFAGQGLRFRDLAIHVGSYH